ncbi:MAG: deoxyribose-phosphate aldolase [Candidatus Kapabacteria bacterium]|jgi:deoxyribose-phosphate aldolase|nr:deoxyribose-phosphate aldolase [Candidatus Kapabacteria bacterium]
MPLSLTPEQQRLAAMIDHTLLKPEATEAAVINLCAEARDYGFASVCVNPCHVKRAVQELQGSAVKVCTVIGFPLGANTTETKMYEAIANIDAGASEVDMVLNIGALVSGNLQAVEDEIFALAYVAHKREDRANAVLKVIIETALLNEEQKIAACGAVTRAGADFIKTSTGFSTGGATVADIELMKKHVGANVHIKASGGIRDLAFAQALIEAGATRIGASAGVAIVEALAGKVSSAAPQGY